MGADSPTFLYVSRRRKSLAISTGNDQALAGRRQHARLKQTSSRDLTSQACRSWPGRWCAEGRDGTRYRSYTGCSRATRNLTVVGQWLTRWHVKPGLLTDVLAGVKFFAKRLRRKQIHQSPEGRLHRYARRLSGTAGTLGRPSCVSPKGPQLNVSVDTVNTLLIRTNRAATARLNLQGSVTRDLETQNHKVM